MVNSFIVCIMMLKTQRLLNSTKLVGLTKLGNRWDGGKSLGRWEIAGTGQIKSTFPCHNLRSGIVNDRSLDDWETVCFGDSINSQPKFFND